MIYCSENSNSLQNKTLWSQFYFLNNANVVSTIKNKWKDDLFE